MSNMDMNMSMTSMKPMGHMHHTTGMPGMGDHGGHMNGMGDNMNGMGGHMTGMGDMNSTGCGMPGMMMYFHTGTCEYVLFEQIKITNAAQMAGACIIIFLLAVVYEGLKCLREYLIQKNSVGTKYFNTTIPPPSSSSSKETIIMESKQTVQCIHNFDHDKNVNTHDVLEKFPWQNVGGSHMTVNTKKKHFRFGKMLSCSHFTQTVLHMLQVFISYCLMLVFMTYNAWLCIAIILGAGAGYFCFGWKRAVVVDINEHCH